MQGLEREGGEERILVNSGPATANSIQELAQQAAQLVTQQLLAGFRVASNPDYSQIDGVPMVEITYTGTVGNGGQATWVHVLTLRDKQFLSVLGRGPSAQAPMVRQQTQGVFRGARMGQMQQNTQLAQAIVGWWTWFHRTELPRRSEGGVSTTKQIAFAPNGRFEYVASTYMKDIPTGVDPTTRASGT